MILPSLPRWTLIAVSIYFCPLSVLSKQDQTLGVDVASSNSIVGSGPVIFLCRELHLPSGRLTGFRTRFSSPLPDDTGAVRFQIWRPLEAYLGFHRMVLIIETRVTPTPGEYHRQLDANDYLRIQAGDKFGFLYEGAGALPIVTAFSPEKNTSCYFRSLSELQRPPLIGNILLFDELRYPYVFSIVITYRPGDADDLTSPNGLTPQVESLTEQTGNDTINETAVNETGPNNLNSSGVETSFGPERGETGATGPPGHTGTRGLSGPQGYTGPTGLPGLQGSTGDMGLPGENGLPGPLGATGATGANGPRGFQGDPGGPGVGGQIGVTGDTGHRGLTGEAGWTGPPGLTGLPGIKGERGRKGTTGPAGALGPAYLDVDECASASQQCAHLCVNLVGSYQCSCYDGYRLAEDGHTCQDINECEEDNGGCQVVCSNTDGSYQCSCPSGLTLSPNNHQCVDSLECQREPRMCAYDDQCMEVYGSYYCIRNIAVLSEMTIMEGEDSTLYQGLNPDTSPEPSEDGLLSHYIVIGLIAWLTVLTLVAVAILVHCGRLCLQARMERQDCARHDDATRLDPKGSIMNNKRSSVFY